MELAACNASGTKNFGLSLHILKIFSLTHFRTFLLALVRSESCTVGVKLEQSLQRPGRALKVPGVEDPRFQDNPHTNVVTS